MSRQPEPDQSPQPQPQYQVVPGNGPATASMVLGIIGVVLALIPILGLIAFPMGVLAIIFGFVGLRKYGKETPKGKGASITGLVLGVLCFVLAIVGMNVVDDAFDQFDQDMQDIQDDLDDL